MRFNTTRKRLCPFHKETTPSMLIDDEAGLFHCLGCGRVGTVANLDCFDANNEKYHEGMEDMKRLYKDLYNLDVELRELLRTQPFSVLNIPMGEGMTIEEAKQMCLDAAMQKVIDKAK